MTANDLLLTISSDSIRSLVREVMVNDIPKYFFHVAASSTGKYHPQFSLGEGGLARHTIVVAYFASRIADAWDCTQHEKDIVIAAALLHDGIKQGKTEGHTTHDHPLLMANILNDKYAAKYPEAKEIAHVIESHMGRWTTSPHSTVVLPKPKDKLQYLLSAADMCAATRELAFTADFFAK